MLSLGWSGCFVCKGFKGLFYRNLVPLSVLQVFCWVLAFVLNFVMWVVIVLSVISDIHKMNGVLLSGSGLPFTVMWGCRLIQFCERLGVDILFYVSQGSSCMMLCCMFVVAWAVSGGIWGNFQSVILQGLIRYIGRNLKCADDTSLWELHLQIFKILEVKPLLITLHGRPTMKLANHFQSSLCKMMSGIFCKICKWMVLNALLMCVH